MATRTRCNVTYTVNTETIDNIHFILANRPGISRSYLIRELVGGGSGPSPRATTTGDEDKDQITP